MEDFWGKDLTYFAQLDILIAFFTIKVILTLSPFLRVGAKFSG